MKHIQTFWTDESVWLFLLASFHGLSWNNLLFKYIYEAIYHSPVTRLCTSIPVTNNNITILQMTLYFISNTGCTFMEITELKKYHAHIQDFLADHNFVNK